VFATMDWVLQRRSASSSFGRFTDLPVPERAQGLDWGWPWCARSRVDTAAMPDTWGTSLAGVASLSVSRCHIRLWKHVRELAELSEQCRVVARPARLVRHGPTTATAMVWSKYRMRLWVIFAGDCTVSNSAPSRA